MEIFRWTARILFAVPLGVVLWWLSAYTGLRSGDLSTLVLHERAALVASSLLVGIVPAIVLALPFYWVYGRWSVLAAAVVSVIVGLSRLPYALNAKSDFATTVFTLEVAAIAVSLPIAVWALRRLRPNNPLKGMPLRGTP